jgi:magnesium-transporting ATPase (P-type)
MSNTTNTNWHALSAKEALNKLTTNLQNGLTTSEVLGRQKTYGLNRCMMQKHDGILRRFLRQFHNVLIYILLASALITVYLAQWVDASVIFGVVILSAIFGIIQEGKAEKALAAIRNMYNTPQFLDH